MDRMPSIRWDGGPEHKTMGLVAYRPTRRCQSGFEIYRKAPDLENTLGRVKLDKPWDKDGGVEDL